jgi:hypothetical protein
MMKKVKEWKHPERDQKKTPSTHVQREGAYSSLAILPDFK